MYIRLTLPVGHKMHSGTCAALSNNILVSWLEKGNDRELIWDENTCHFSACCRNRRSCGQSRLSCNVSRAITQIICTTVGGDVSTAQHIQSIKNTDSITHLTESANRLSILYIIETDTCTLNN